MANNRDLSQIKSLQDLQREILNIKAGLVVHENQLKTRMKQVPAQTKHLAVKKLVPATLAKIIPFVLTSGAVVKSWGLLRNAAGLISVFRKQKKGGVKNKLVTTVKNVGAAAVIKGIFNFIKKRKQSKTQIEVS